MEKGRNVAHQDWHAEYVLADIRELHLGDTDLPFAAVGDTFTAKSAADDLVAETDACRLPSLHRRPQVRHAKGDEPMILVDGFDSAMLVT